MEYSVNVNFDPETNPGPHSHILWIELDDSLLSAIF